MTIRTDLTAAWSTGISTTRDCVVQCRRGVVYLNYDSVAPSSIKDGFQMVSGVSFVVKGGNTFRLAAEGGQDHEVWFAEFTV